MYSCDCPAGTGHFTDCADHPSNQRPTTITLDLVHEPKPESILLGYSIGSAILADGRKLEVVASGKLVRFSVEEIPGHVDLDISDAASAAADILTDAE